MTLKEQREHVSIEICPVCGEPTEKAYPLDYPLPRIKRPTPCKCMRKKMEAEAAATRQREHETTVRRNRLICFRSSRMARYTFGHSSNDGKAIRIARNYADHWEDVKGDNQGLLLWGNVGSGKSYIAACIANALIEKEVTVKMTNVVTILNDVFEHNDKNPYINDLCKYELLIIDDLGAERSSGYAVETLFHVIDTRYRTGRPLIITTNLLLNEEIKKPSSIGYERIYSRILEMCRPVSVVEEDRRQTIAQTQFDQLQAIVDQT